MSEVLKIKLTKYALENGWSASMYEIVCHDIDNDRFANEQELMDYITQPIKG